MVCVSPGNLLNSVLLSLLDTTPQLGEPSAFGLQHKVATLPSPVMQDLRSIPGAGQIFGVSGGGVLPGGAVAAEADRRLRPHPQQNLKCPRCDSHNTKFCYYNNYNLSQPRHFCKNCRRYWTKGGVLRNVPVGGGCRKAKRSSSSSSSSKPSTKSSSNGCKDSRRHSPPAAAGSRSSSDSSTLTAAAADATMVTQDPVAADPGLDSYAAVLLESINEGTAAPAGGDDIFPGTGSFTGLIAAAANPDALGLSFGYGSQLHLPPAQQLPKTAPPPAKVGVVVDDQIKMPGITVEQRYMDQMVQIDWQGGMDAPAGLFDAAGDHGGYWNHGQWGEIDPSLFLP